ncbi:MAG: ABC transporter permease [Prevotellaceae bacterium]|jgi:putative ABC transport system permease protein|nr:ABC transporter permease [Prevotellaceae bacterium]
MIRILFKQIWNERKTNTWLWAELLLVFVALWVVVDWTYVNVHTWVQPLGFDIEDTYLVQISVKTADNPTFRPDGERMTGQDAVDIVERLRREPEVEAVGYGLNAFPYNGSNSFSQLAQDSVRWSVHVRNVSPDFFRIFRYENIDGSGYQSLVEALEEDKLIVSENLWPERYPDGKNLLGQGFYVGGDTTQLYSVAAVTRQVRYDDFSIGDTYFLRLFPESNLASLPASQMSFIEFYLRVKAGTPAGYAKRLLRESPRINVGNCYIESVRSFDDIRESYMLGRINALKNRVFIMAFLLVNIFLGVIGTFWYRTQQRRGELGLRMALGSSRRQLYNNLIGEGLLLLGLSALPALLICFNIGYADLVGAWQMEWGGSRFVIGTSLTLLLMALMIIGAIAYPASQAMKTQPADALHDE